MKEPKFTDSHRKLIKEFIMEDFDIRPSRAEILINILENTIKCLIMFIDDSRENKNEKES